jgi:hypothetical protein
VYVQSAEVDALRELEAACVRIADVCADVIQTVTAARVFYGEPQRGLQHKIAQALSTAEYNKVIADLSGSTVEEDQRRTSFLSGQGGHAGLWLLANIADPANRLQDDQFRILMQLRLGHLFVPPHTKCEGCNAFGRPPGATGPVPGMPRDGAHLGSCIATRVYRTTRHTGVKDELMAWLRMISSHCVGTTLRSFNEPTVVDYFPLKNGLSAADAKTAKRTRADVAVVFASNPNAVLLLDVVITFARPGVRKSANYYHTAGFAATQEVAKKNKHYKQYFTDDAVRQIIPFALECYGHMDELAAGVLRKILRTALGIVGRVPAETLDTYNYLLGLAFERVSVALARHTAQMAAAFVRSCLPPA